MLKLTWIEFFLRTIPEMFILIWGIYVISRNSFNNSHYVFSSTIMAILTFFVRWLPIYWGVHMILNMILTISIMIIVDIPLIKSIYSTLIMFFVLCLSEYLNLIILNLLNIDTNFQLLEPVKKCVLTLPSLIITSVFIIIIHHLFSKKDQLVIVNS
ncbi:hypothetical protein HBE96_17685 [Clostridium sp. P21]|uniref:Uncharacterized protein n=1 Tax=Clostridium muellerianum TaxID=2716538 RepID=A0A7Y0EJ62_9CLOT|nr:hypothetical protein [Clostridium muellerianum]NMM64451.1 hypothetical protein [Clostridium muellerianum]